MTITATPTAATPFTPPTPRAHLRVRSADGVHINVEIHGPGDAPTVVLVHGWTCSIPFWAPAISALPDLRVVAYDQRGHGKSDVPGQGHYSVQALVDDLEAVLEATLPKQQTAVLVGHSMGGMAVMAAGLSSIIMSRTSAIVLASTGFSNLMAGARIVPFATRSPKLGLALHRRLLYSSLPLGHVTPMARAAVKYGTLSRSAPKELATATATIVHACPRTSRAAWGRVLATVEVEAGARALDVPTKVVVGQEDRLTPPHHAEAIAKALPQRQGLTELPNVGHMTPLEAPHVIATLTRSLTPTPTPSSRSLTPDPPHDT
jgi:pimeloyl-ACP methyl ester carboxylesterase